MQLHIKTVKALMAPHSVSVEIRDSTPQEILEVQPFIVAVLEAQKFIRDVAQRELPPQATA